MAQIVLTPTHLELKLSKAERIFALHGDLAIPAALVRGAEVGSADVWKTLGLRIPGTGVPMFLYYGSFWRAGKSGGWTFSLWRANHQSVVINLATGKANRFKRLVVAVEDAQRWADTINDALVSC
ncbi:hypothetical protein [Rhodoluna limnophila]|uniref:hypothetical protein n=1 Tax=Rhodoluna limnophila TaxID=232537 RepID=UPI001105B310|nr:hypothetical protein [Rhodoluna limnophila]